MWGGGRDWVVLLQKSPKDKPPIVHTTILQITLLSKYEPMYWQTPSLVFQSISCSFFIVKPHGFSKGKIPSISKPCPPENEPLEESFEQVQAQVIVLDSGSGSLGFWLGLREIKWILVKCQGDPTKCWSWGSLWWTSIPSRGSTSSCFILQKH